VGFNVRSARSRIGTTLLGVNGNENVGMKVGVVTVTVDKGEVERIEGVAVGSNASCKILVVDDVSSLCANASCCRTHSNIITKYFIAASSKLKVVSNNGD